MFVRSKLLRQASSLSGYLSSTRDLVSAVVVSVEELFTPKHARRLFLFSAVPSSWVLSIYGLIERVQRTCSVSQCHKILLSEIEIGTQIHL